MGFFGGFVFDGQAWADWDPDADSTPSIAEPWLSVLIHDSDIATIGFSPAGGGLGLAYLGTTPRVYFEDDHASAPTDVAREAAALGEWRSDLEVEPSRTPAEWAAVIEPFLASDHDPEPSEDGDLADADTFVEVKTVQLLRALGLPLPADLDDVG